jgi:dienelactone hydrolase
MRAILLAAAVLGLTAPGIAAAPAPEWIEFPSATTPPTPFELKQEPGTPLRGLLVRPEGEGPFPAVVLLHGCDGIQPFQEQWAADLADWGYVALLTDSHGPRGGQGTCATWSSEVDEQPFDAYGALAYLRGLSFVDPARIGAMGWDTGGHAVLQVVDEKGVQQHFGERFAAGVTLYPTFTHVRRAGAPLLILLGDEDDCVPVAQVERGLRDIDPGPFPIRLELLPGVGNGFDDPRYAVPVRLAKAPFCLSWPAVAEATRAYSRAMHEVAAERVRAFLAQHLKQHASTERPHGFSPLRRARPGT